MKISGHLDLCGPALIEGWLYSEAWQGEPIRLQVYVGDLLLGECTADRYRRDLQEAGFGTGNCGFSFAVSSELGLTDFSQTKLRLLESPVYLLPDDASNIARFGKDDENPGSAEPVEHPEHTAHGTATLHEVLATDQIRASGGVRRGVSF